MSKWIPVERQPYNGQRVLLSFANRADDEGGAFYAPFTGRTYASLGYFVNAWAPLPKPYRLDDSMKDEERLVL